MLTLGLVGGSGSGKGTVCSLFERFDFKSIDTDSVYRKMTQPNGECIAPLVAEFGTEILNEDGSLNRRNVSDIIFTKDKTGQFKAKLEEITHKLILDETRKLLNEYRRLGVAATLVDAPLLFESGFDKECDLIISVVADKDVRVARIVQRDNISENIAKARINSQLSDDYLLSRSDFYIVNNGTIKELETQVSDIAEKILSRGK